jgi:hypothetical protein
MEPKTGQILLPKDIYMDFIRTAVQANPKLQIVKLRNRKVVVPYVLVNGETVVMTYSRWFNAIAVYLGKARERVIEGDRFRMGNIGWLHAKRIERNFRNKQINWKLTNSQEKIFDKEKQKWVPACKVYYTGDDYCRIGWTQRRGHAMLYKFLPTNSSLKHVGFKQQFSNANMQNPALKLRYIYYPYK